MASVGYIGIERHPASLRELVRSMLKEKGWDIFESIYEDSSCDIKKTLSESDAILFAPARYLPYELLKCAEKCKIFQIWSSGYDKFNLEAAKKLGIPTCNNGGGNAVAVSEHAIMMILATYKNLINNHMRTINGNWQGNSHGMDQFILKGKRLGIVGLGSIGCDVARLGKAFNAEVQFYDPFVDNNDYKKVSLETLLATSDIISLHVHLSVGTANMISYKEFGMMKSNCVVINVSRGELIDKEAFIKALYSGQIFGAALDAFHQEPTTGDDPLLNHPRVIATPHMACTYDTHVSALEKSIENIERAIEDKPPFYQV